MPNSTTGILNLSGGPYLDADDGHLSDEIAYAVELYTGRSGLEDFCKDGGVVTNVDICVSVRPDRKGGIAKGTFQISFFESYSSGCRDIKWRNYFEGQGSFTLVLNTGELQIRTEAACRLKSEEEYEPEEPTSEPGAAG